MHADSDRNARSYRTRRGNILIDLLLSLWIVTLFLPMIPTLV